MGLCIIFKQSFAHDCLGPTTDLFHGCSSFARWLGAHFATASMSLCQEMGDIPVYCYFMGKMMINDQVLEYFDFPTNSFWFKVRPPSLKYWDAGGGSPDPQMQHIFTAETINRSIDKIFGHVDSWTVLCFSSRGDMPETFWVPFVPENRWWSARHGFGTWRCKLERAGAWRKSLNRFKVARSCNLGMGQ